MAGASKILQKVLGLSAEAAVTWLEGAQRQGLSVEAPQVEDNVRLLSAYGLKEHAIRSIGQASPRMLLGPPETLQGVLDQLRVCGIGPEMLGRVAASSSVFHPPPSPTAEGPATVNAAEGPAPATTDLAAQVGGRLQFLSEIVGWGELRGLLQQCPGLLGAPLARLQADVSALAAAVGGAQEVGKVVKLSPCLLESTELTDTILHFLLQVCPAHCPRYPPSPHPKP